MKCVKKILKVLLVLIVSTLSIYFMLTIAAFTNWCNDNQIFLKADEILLKYKN